MEWNGGNCIGIKKVKKIEWNGKNCIGIKKVEKMVEKNGIGWEK